MPTSALEPPPSVVCSADWPTLQPGQQEVKPAGLPAAQALPAPRVAGGGPLHGARPATVKLELVRALRLRRAMARAGWWN
jgi:hypothetical protein